MGLRSSPCMLSQAHLHIVRPASIVTWPMASAEWENGLWSLARRLAVQMLVEWRIRIPTAVAESTVTSRVVAHQKQCDTKAHNYRWGRLVETSRLCVGLCVYIAYIIHIQFVMLFISHVGGTLYQANAPVCAFQSHMKKEATAAVHKVPIYIYFFSCIRPS